MPHFPTWLIITVASILGIIFLFVVIGVIASVPEDETTLTQTEPTSTPTPEVSPTPRSVVEQRVTENDLVCENHRELSHWGIVSEAHDPYVELASLQVPLSNSTRYNPDYYQDIRALVPCNDHILAVSFVAGDTFEKLLVIHKRHYPDAGVFSPYLYCERVKKITDLIATALEQMVPTTPQVIEEQVTVIRELDVGGRLSDEHAYLLAFADALEAALPDMESIIVDNIPTDMTRIDAVTDASNALAPVMRDVCDPSIIN